MGKLEINLPQGVPGSKGVDDANLEAEGLDNGVDDTDDEEGLLLEDADDEEDVDDSDTGEEDDEEENEEEEEPLKFTDKQQEEINRIVKDRLKRQDKKLISELSKAAGVDITQEDITPATQLWGLLKSNPDFAHELDVFIGEALKEGRAVAPKLDNNSDLDVRTKKLELKEAVVDLKAKDVMFSKYSDKILKWAEREGLDVTTPQELKLAYLAWKGSQGKFVEAAQKQNAKRKQETKKTMQKRASVQTPKGGNPAKGDTDYRKVSDSDLLSQLGLSLFTDD